MKEKLVFKIANNRIAELFGMQNFSSKEVAILELVKNAYDAGASFVNVEIGNDSIVIKDDGVGMTKDTIRNKWMDVGVSDKDYDFISVNNEKRVYSGSKGIGRFALARLGQEIELVSRQKDSDALCWMTDWVENILDDYSYDNIGTQITIKKLNDRWDLNESKKLARYISSYKFYDRFKAVICFENEKIECNNIFDDVALGKNALTEISFSFASNTGKLFIKLKNAEFDDTAQIMLEAHNEKEQNKKLIVASNIYGFEKEINVFDELLRSEAYSKYNEDDIVSVGDFDGVIFYNNGYSKNAAKNFLYVWPRTTDLFPSNLSGLFLVRNAFCISGYSGDTDWLGFGKRTRKSPAAASHKTGRWRVRENQIAGAIKIDKRINAHINELQNRQGIEENASFILLKAVVELVLDCFEKYRQYIVRVVDEKNEKEIIVEKETIQNVNRFIKDPVSFKEMPKEKIEELASDVSIIVSSSNAEKSNFIKKQADLEYASRILHSLSTLGLKSASIAHELFADRNNISSFYPFTVAALQKYGFWEALTDSEHTKNKASNVPELLAGAKKTNDVVINYIDTMLNTIDKSKFVDEKVALKETIEEICSRWKNEYSWVFFNTDEVDDVSFWGSKDIFETIFGNLILNSVQQNDKKDKLKISIKVNQNSEKTLISYEDDGVGLQGEFLDDPFSILEPNKTSRKNGHGLGMWIVNNIIVDNGGKIIDIEGEKGFSILFTLKEKKYA